MASANEEFQELGEARGCKSAAAVCPRTCRSRALESSARHKIRELEGGRSGLSRAEPQWAREAWPARAKPEEVHALTGERAHEDLDEGTREELVVGARRRGRVKLCERVREELVEEAPRRAHEELDGRTDEEFIEELCRRGQVELCWRAREEFVEEPRRRAHEELDKGAVEELDAEARRRGQAELCERALEEFVGVHGELK